MISKAAIFVRDEPLAASLIFLLAACGIEAVGVSAEADDALEAAWLFADHRRGGLALVARLRALGWRGRAVLLTEQAETGEAPADVTVLEKPFGAAEVTAVIGALAEQGAPVRFPRK